VFLNINMNSVSKDLCIVLYGLQRRSVAEERFQNIGNLLARESFRIVNQNQVKG